MNELASSRASPSCSRARSPKDLAPGTPRRRALDAALAEIDEGREAPSIEWRRDFSLMLGLERLLSEDEPHLADGAELSAHQVDALSGTLAALIADVQERINGHPWTGNGNGRRAVACPPSRTRHPRTGPSAPTRRPRGGGGRGGGHRGGGGRGLDRGDEDEDVVEEAPEDPGANRRFWFEHATGSGKTVAAVGFIEASRTGGILILTHRRNLVDQFIGEISDRGYADRLSPPLLDGADHPYGPVTVETYQWFVRNAGRISDAYSIVICDEAHTALGEKTSACIRAWPGPVFIGMTATGALIARHVTDLFPTQTSRFDLAQAARRGVIAPLRCVRIPPGPGVRTIAKVPLRKGEVDQDFDQEELAKLLDQTPFNVAIADLYRSRFRRVPGVVYTAGVKHANNVAKAFQDAGINARAVSGETPKRELAEILAGFERGEVDVLCNAMLLAEGWNSPRATICMHLAPTASRRVYQQRVGRVTRRNPGKEAGLVIDFVHPATTHDETIVTLHSLLDRDVYRGGAIVVGPVRRGRGRRVRVEKRVVPGLRRLEPPPARAGARALADRGREPEPLRAARLGSARGRPRQPLRLAPRQGDAPARPDQGAPPPLPAHLRAAQPQPAAADQGADGDRRAARRGRLRRRDRHDRHLAARRPPGRDQGHARGARRAPDRPPRPGSGLGLAPRRLHPRPARGVRGPALARDQAPARPAGQLIRPGPRPQRPPPGPRRAQPGSPPRRGSARRRHRAHARGRGGSARGADARRPQALSGRPRAAPQLPQVGWWPPKAPQAQGRVREERWRRQGKRRAHRERSKSSRWSPRTAPAGRSTRSSKAAEAADET